MKCSSTAFQGYPQTLSFGVIMMRRENCPLQQLVKVGLVDRAEVGRGVAASVVRPSSGLWRLQGVTSCP